MQCPFCDSFDTEELSDDRYVCNECDEVFDFDEANDAEELFDPDDYDEDDD